jgi:hypothetical protein
MTWQARGGSGTSCGLICDYKDVHALDFTQYQAGSLLLRLRICIYDDVHHTDR